MASPVKPSDTEAVVINPSDPWCVAWKKFMKFMYLYYLWTRYRWNEDGEIADDWHNDLCAAVADCPTIE